MPEKDLTSKEQSEKKEASELDEVRFPAVHMFMKFPGGSLTIDSPAETLRGEKLRKAIEAIREGRIPII